MLADIIKIEMFGIFVVKISRGIFVVKIAEGIFAV